MMQWFAKIFIRKIAQIGWNMLSCLFWFLHKLFCSFCLLFYLSNIWTPFPVDSPASPANFFFFGIFLFCFQTSSASCHAANDHCTASNPISEFFFFLVKLSCFPASLLSIDIFWLAVLPHLLAASSPVCCLLTIRQFFFCVCVYFIETSNFSFSSKQTYFFLLPSKTKQTNYFFMLTEHELKIIKRKHVHTLCNGADREGGVG
jgi:hypothetical protein